MKIMGSLLFPFSLVLLITISSPLLVSAQQPFRCSSPGATCAALIDYVTPNATTISALAALFTVTSDRSILGANNLPPSTHRVAANQTIRIPFPCICTTNGTGISNGGPNYTVVPGDGLSQIAASVFSGLITFQQIAAANNISDPNLIDVGQILRIPLPCSCDDVDGRRMVHYGHVVAPGSSVDEIAARYNTSRETLWRLNNLNSTSSLQIIAGSVLDVPLTTCTSMVNISSRDHPLLVPNGTYQLTANDCVRCSCNAESSWTLQCEASRINSTCGPIRCEGPGSLFLGNSTSSGCNRTTCAYAGYNNQGPLTELHSDSTCPASGNPSSGMSLGGQRWNVLLIFIQVMMFSFFLFSK